MNLDLFEPRARTTDPATSHEAAAMVDAESQRGRILDLLSPALLALTADEIDEILGRVDGRWRLTTAGRRLSELKRRDIIVARLEYVSTRVAAHRNRSIAAVA